MITLEKHGGTNEKFALGEQLDQTKRVRIFIAFAVMLCPTFVSADPVTKDCHQWFVVAQKLMTDRQAGRHMPNMLREVERLPEDQREAARKMVAQVFQFPRTRIGSVRQSMIREFADAALAACHKG